MNTLRQRWLDDWSKLGLAGDMAWLERVLAAYAEAGRHYHTQQHLAECRALFDEVACLAQHPGEVAIALWFHDAVYVPQAKDNEGRSAEWAAAALRDAGAGEAAIARVHALVMATAHHAATGDGDTQLVVDIDLAILGAPPARFAQYGQQVRAEYANVPDAVYQVKRRAVLASFLARPDLYATPALHASLEHQARRNLQGAIEVS